MVYTTRYTVSWDAMGNPTKGIFQCIMHIQLLGNISTFLLLMHMSQFNPLWPLVAEQLSLNSNILPKTVISFCWYFGPSNPYPSAPLAQPHPQTSEGPTTLKHHLVSCAGHVNWHGPAFVRLQVGGGMWWGHWHRTHGWNRSWQVLPIMGAFLKGTSVVSRITTHTTLMVNSSLNS